MATTESMTDVLEIIETPELDVEESGHGLLRTVLIAIGVAAIVATVVTVVVRRKG